MTDKSPIVKRYERELHRQRDPAYNMTRPIRKTPTVAPTLEDVDRIIESARKEPELQTWAFGELALRRLMTIYGTPQINQPADIESVTAFMGYKIWHDRENPWRAEML